MNTTFLPRLRGRDRLPGRLSMLAGTALLALLPHHAAAQTAPQVPYDTMVDIGDLPNAGGFALMDVSDDGSAASLTIYDSQIAPSGYRWTSQGLQPLGSLGGPNSNANAISGDGKVIVGGTGTLGIGYRAFRWTEQGGMQLLGNLGVRSVAIATSQDGSVIAGTFVQSDSNSRAFRWTQQGGMQELGTLGGAQSQASDISADGQVIVGRSTTADSPFRAFRWTQATGMQSLGTLGEQSEARKISRDGSTIIGTFNLPLPPAPGASFVLYSFNVFRWTEAGGMQEIPLFGGPNNTVADLSDNGKVVVGMASTPTGSRAFYWVEGRGTQALNPLAGNYSSAAAVSGDGKIVVGTTSIAVGSGSLHAYRWTEEKGMQDLGTLGGDRSEARAISRDGSTIFGSSQTADGKLRAFIYRTQMIDFTNMIASFALTASDVEALGEGQRQNLGWVLDSTCRVAIGGKGCIGGAVQVMRVAADDKAVLMRRHDQGVKANVGVRLSGALTMGAGFGLFQQEDRAFSLKPDTAFHYGAWLDFAPGGEGPLGFKARLAAGGAVQGNAIERGRGLDNVELTPGRADLATLSARGQVEYGIALGKLALIPNAGITWQRSTLGAFAEAEGDFPAQFGRTRWQTSFASLGADLSVPLGAGTRAVLGGKADFDLDSDAVTMIGTSTIPGMEAVKATSLYTRKDRRGRFELGLEHLSGKLGFSARAGVHTPVIGSKPTFVVGLGFGAGF